jgi:hypothetical protein
MKYKDIAEYWDTEKLITHESCPKKEYEIFIMNLGKDWMNVWDDPFTLEDFENYIEHLKITEKEGEKCLTI